MKLSNNLPIYSPYLDDKDLFSHCFFTGTAINPIQDRIRIFPDTVIKSYNLEKQKLTLLSGQKIGYDELVIPISFEVGAKVQKLLHKGLDLMQAGVSGLKFLKENELTQFLSLVFNAVVLQEVQAARLMPNEQNTFLLEGAFANKAYIISLALHEILREVRFEDFKPTSLFKFQTYTYENPQNFELITALNVQSVMLRMGEVCIMACLLDNNIQEKFYKDYFINFESIITHPIQLNELFSRLCYKSYLVNQVFEYGLQFPSALEDFLSIKFRVPDSEGNKEVFRAWNDLEYIEILTSFMKSFGFTRDDLFDPKHGVATFIENDKGDPIQMDEFGNELD